ncbi:hypothetical protein SEA_BURRO_42 [Microbacterium phage Burro]|uniref:Uncharacterized protein n=1 Tax=Microbacterium phage Burro TaxID=2315703 RepID=A0A386KKK9_9CAUD|nr:hypothetical protein HWB89_gp42 [Microbacterium phage Burro]AYD86185.1 hypothetical protein SEA_BURRO_42 [Microbacterium phage Burro]
MPLPGPIIQGVTSGGVVAPFRVNTLGQLETSQAANPVGTTGPSKIEDAVHVSGDMGTFVLGVRQQSPLATTSAANDYTALSTNGEGKLLTATAADQFLFSTRTDLTAVTDVAVAPAKGANIRNWISDIIVENTGAAAARLLLRDVTTTVLSVTVPAGSTYILNLGTPIRNAAVNTAFNAQLGAAGTVTLTLVGYQGS